MNQPVQRPKLPNADTNDDDNGDGGVVRLVALDTNGRTVEPTPVEGGCDATKSNGASQSPSQDDEAAAADDETCQSQLNAAILFSPGQTFHVKMMASATNESGQSYLPPNTQYLTQTTEGGKFLGRSSMCDGTRAVARKRDDTVRMQLTGEQDVVRVWAGYASEKAAVILTPELVFRLDPSGVGRGNSRSGAPGAASPSPAPASVPSPTSAPSVPTIPVAAPVEAPEL